MIFKRRFIPLLCLCLAASACSVLELAPSTGYTRAPEATPTIEMSTGTPTIVWFPATETATPLPYSTYTPTPQMDPGVGDTLLEDNFSDEEAWNTAVSDKGSASIERNRLTAFIHQTPVGVAVWEGPELRCRVFNEAYEKLIRRPIELGVRIHELLGPLQQRLGSPVRA